MNNTYIGALMEKLAEAGVVFQKEPLTNQHVATYEGEEIGRARTVSECVYEAAEALGETNG